VCLMLFITTVAAAQDLVIYSGRSKGLIEPILKQWEAQTGTRARVRYGDTAQLAIALQEEGSHSTVDLFWAQDAGALGALSKTGLLRTLPDTLISRVAAPFHNPSGMWVATSGRARVLAYSRARVLPEDLPASVFDLTQPQWKGRVGWAPTNASFQAFITAMRLVAGEEKTRAWLSAMKANEAKAYARNTAIIEAIAAGEIDLGLNNHYYLLRFTQAEKNYPVAQVFFAPHDIGNLVNVAGLGILHSSRHPKQAEAFIAFVLADHAQQFFTTEVFEYPVIAGLTPAPDLVSPAELARHAPKVNPEDLNDLPGTLQLMREVGLL
jgi:iron(III) transport system substrate-binding protein